MTPKEKAEELVGKYYYLVGSLFEQKECAKILVDEIINTLNMDIRDVDVRGNILLDLINWWEEVKKEIELL